MGFTKALLKIVGGSASVATLEPASIVSGLCSVVSGTMEMKDVVEDFISAVTEITGSGLSYVYNFYKIGEDPCNIMPVMEVIRKLLQASGNEWIFACFKESLRMYALSKGDYDFSELQLGHNR